MQHLLKTLEKLSGQKKQMKCPKKCIKQLEEYTLKRCGMMARFNMVKPFMISGLQDLADMEAYGPIPYAVTELIWRLNDIGKAKLMQHN